MPSCFNRDLAIRIFTLSVAETLTQIDGSERRGPGLAESLYVHETCLLRTAHLPLMQLKRVT